MSGESGRRWRHSVSGARRARAVADRGAPRLRAARRALLVRRSPAVRREARLAAVEPSSPCADGGVARPGLVPALLVVMTAASRLPSSSVPPTGPAARAPDTAQAPQPALEGLDDRQLCRLSLARAVPGPAQPRTAATLVRVVARPESRHPRGCWLETLSRTTTAARPLSDADAAGGVPPALASRKNQDCPHLSGRSRLADLGTHDAGGHG